MASKNKLTKKEMTVLENLLAQVAQTDIMLESAQLMANDLFMNSKDGSRLERVSSQTRYALENMASDLAKSKSLIEDLLNTAQANGGKTK